LEKLTKRWLNGIIYTLKQEIFAMVTPAEAKSYARGQRLGAFWCKDGGNLNADGPDTKDEAFYNGFIDYLAEERRKLANQSK
jgi:hypothetical protein